MAEAISVASTLPVTAAPLKSAASAAVAAATITVSFLETMTTTTTTEKGIKDNGISSSHTETAGADIDISTSRELHLYPVLVKLEGGGNLELQLNPGDTVVDVRQFLLDSNETCFFTCYDLLLHDKEDSVHYLGDYTEISEVADITTGSCFLEMVSALYDDRSVRAHVLRSRELISSKILHPSFSTSIVLKHETAKYSTFAYPAPGKIYVPELDGFGFVGSVTCELNDLLSPPSKYIKCVESILFSAFNPPPTCRRLVGDLIYLDVIILENNKFCVTGSTRSFFVNSSTGNTFDPTQRKSTHEATTLIGLLQKLSSKFNKNFAEVLKQKSLAHPFENIQSLLPPNPWLELYTMADHRRDAARAENSVMVSFGGELMGMQRDWNEELHTCREFPHSTTQERILRGRALYKVTSDFVDAAKSGAMGVISGCIPPINPADPECFHMYVHNNIFFSFTVDTDMEQLSKIHLPVSDSSAENGISNSLTDDFSDNHVDGSCDTLTGECRRPSNAVGNGCKLERSHDLIAETYFSESEQATYASANNDLIGTRTCLEADVPGLYNLAMAIIDYRGYRVIAQSILPGILQGDKSKSLLYGSVDSGKQIFWNEAFHAKVLEAAKRLHMKEHTVLDASGNAFRFAAPVECKGIVGCDDRYYILDLMRVAPRDANFVGPGSRYRILRPELIYSFCQAEASERYKGEERRPDVDCDEITKTLEGVVRRSDVDCDEVTKTLEESVVLADSSGCFEKKEQAEENVDTSFSFGSTQNIVETGLRNHMKCTREIKTEENGRLAGNESKDIASNMEHHDPQGFESKPDGEAEKAEAILFNPNVFTEFKLGGSEEEISLDEEVVRKASMYLTDKVLPKFIHDLCILEVSPMDGQTLTEAFHSHGINIRYIGRVAEETKSFPHIRDLCVIEIVVRSAKHILKDILRDAEDFELGPAVSHFFNCFFGNCLAAIKNLSDIGQSKPIKKGELTHGLQMKPLRTHKHSKGPFFSGMRQSMYKNMCSASLWSDIIEFSKLKYQFELTEDERYKVKKVAVIRNLCQKVGIIISARKYDLSTDTPFQVIDILNIQPLAKHSIPFCSEAKDLVEAGKAMLAEGLLKEAFEQFSKAYSIFQQVTGPMHRDVANCCRYLAIVLYHVGDVAGAIIEQHKELIINESCLGLDHPDTAHSYGNMALFYHGVKQTELALQHIYRGLLLLGISCGPDHPDVSAAYRNVAMMYQDIGKVDTALRYLQEALNKNVKLLGEHHVQTAVCYHALAIAFNSMGAFKLSKQHEKKTYDILVSQLGNDDLRVIESQNWLKTFKMRELEANAQKQKAKTPDTLSAQEALDILKAHPHLLHAFRAADGVGTGGSGSGATTNKIGSSPVVRRRSRGANQAGKEVVAKGFVCRRLGGVPTQVQSTQVQPQVPAQIGREGEAVVVPEGLGKGLGPPQEKNKKKGKGKGLR